MPMRLDEGWNQVQFNLADFVKRAYGTTYVETLRVQVNCFGKKMLFCYFCILICFTIVKFKPSFFSDCYDLFIRQNEAISLKTVESR